MTSGRWRIGLFLGALMVLAGLGAGEARPLKIVAVGASNTQGWYVGNQGAYPARLALLLKARGIDAEAS